MKKLLAETADRAARYVTGIANRQVVPLPANVARLEALGGPLPELPSDPSEVLALLDDIGSPATVATTGGRYFGFVIGGSLPAALAANWLAGAWDQNAAMQVMSPVAAKLEEIVLEWMVDLLGLPSGHDDGKLLGLGRSADRATETRRMGRRGGRIVWGATDSRGGGRRSSHVGAEGVIDAGARAFATDTSSGGRPGTDAAGRTASARRLHAGLRSSRKREHRCV